MTTPQESAAEENRKHEGTFPGNLGVRFVEVSPERVSATLEVGAGHLQPFGFAHGGVFVSLADTCASVASVQGLAADKTALTVQLSINYLASVKSGILEAEAVAVHRGNRSMVYETRVKSAEGRLMAVVTTSHLVVSFS